MSGSIVVREMVERDCSVIARAFAEQGWNKPVSQYLNYFHESREGKRAVLVAEYNKEFAGYLTIVWDSNYPPFQVARIPEIVDFNVLLKYRRQGIGTALMDTAEERVGVRSAVVGIGVGLTFDYGAAQILYMKRGYLPDGRGVFRHGHYLKHGEQTVTDGSLILYLTKSLKARP